MVAKELRKKYEDAVVDKCAERGCKLCLPSSGSIILKGEKLQPCFSTNGLISICDCFVFDDVDGVRVVIAELKSSSLNHTQITKKFEQSVGVVKQILQRVGYFGTIHLALVLLAKTYSTSQHNKLFSIRIGTGKSRRRILLKRCKCVNGHTVEYESETVPRPE